MRRLRAAVFQQLSLQGPVLRRVPWCKRQASWLQLKRLQILHTISWAFFYLLLECETYICLAEITKLDTLDYNESILASNRLSDIKRTSRGQIFFKVQVE
jgi:hypothetical protein